MLSYPVSKSIHLMLSIYLSHPTLSKTPISYLTQPLVPCKQFNPNKERRKIKSCFPLPKRIPVDISFHLIIPSHLSSPLYPTTHHTTPTTH